MTRIFDEAGIQIPVTLVKFENNVVTQIKDIEKDGYEAIQVAFDDKKEKHTSKAMQGHFAKAGVTPKKVVAEFTRFEADHQKTFGDILKVDIFTEGEFIDVVGIAKGKGFQGVVRRHGFAGVGGATHGQHNRLRAPGSVGASSYPSRVFKGMRMGGRMGGNRVKIINLQILKIVPEQNLILVKGAVPGSKGSYLIVERWS